MFIHYVLDILKKYIQTKIVHSCQQDYICLQKENNTTSAVVMFINDSQYMTINDIQN